MSSRGYPCGIRRACAGAMANAIRAGFFFRPSISIYIRSALTIPGIDIRASMDKKRHRTAGLFSDEENTLSFSVT